MGRDGSGVGAQVAAAARLWPKRPALVDGTRTLSHEALARLTASLAVRLTEEGVAAGDCVGLALPRSIERIAFTLAAWRVGAAAVLIDPAWPARRIAAVADDADCRQVVLAATHKVDRLDPARTLIYPMDQPEKLTGRGEVACLEPKADALAYLVYTSGSTGTPKGVEISHGNLSSLVDWHKAAFIVSPNDRATHLAGVAFDAAIWEVFPNLAAGASVHLVPEAARIDPDRLHAWLLETQATLSFAPTILAEALIDRPWPANAPLRFLLTGGDRLRRHPPAGLPFTLVNNYGPSECTVVTTSGVVPPDPAATRPPSIGTPIAGATVCLLDEAGRLAAQGEVGEICIGGALVGVGYRGRMEETRHRFVPDPLAPGARLYRSGDLARWRQDGTLDFAGRLDDQIKLRGQRVEPDEVAAQVLLHPDVAAAAVIGVTQASGPVLAAYVVPATGAKPAPEALRAFLLDRLPDWSVPAFFVTLDALPLTPNGKLDRAALPDPRGPASEEEAVKLTEARLLAIVQSVLGGAPVGVNDNFFLLGGHSLLGTQMVLRAGDAFGVELTLAHLFQAPTVRELALKVEELVLEAVAAMSDEELAAAHG